MAKMGAARDEAVAAVTAKVATSAPTAPEPRPVGRFAEQKRELSFKGFKVER